tara:strand:- start:130 stop:312 length:183 start_codon:yes stop_codon:yes gene_type:complete
MEIHMRFNENPPGIISRGIRVQAIDPKTQSAKKVMMTVTGRLTLKEAMALITTASVQDTE